MTPPDLTFESGPILVFTDNEDWRNSITGISYFSVNPDGNTGEYFEENIYNISPGEIEMVEGIPPLQDIDSGSFPEGWDSEGFPVEIFVVYADGYEDALAFWAIDFR